MSSLPSQASFFLTLVRHGETPANKLRIIQGQSNVPLSDHGRLQAQHLRKHLESMDIKFDLAYASDLSRAYETCEIVVGPGREIATDDRLRERAFGDIEGKTLDVFRAEAAKAGHSERNYSSFTPRGAETLDNVNGRVRDFCHYLLKVVEPGYHVLVVTHGGVIREFARFFRDRLNCNLREVEPMRCSPNTGVNVFKLFFRNEQKLISADCLKMHETDHLDGLDDNNRVIPTVLPFKQAANDGRLQDYVPLEAL